MKLLALVLALSAATLAHAKVREGLIDTAHGPIHARFEESSEGKLFEGDIIVAEHDPNDKAVSARFGRWKNAVVPYVIDPAIPDPQKIHAAIDEYHQKTRVRWVPRSTERDYVYFKFNGDAGCSSWIGKAIGKQVINVPKWCDKGGMIHEMMHALGFYHEQSRWDRNKYITIKWDNIKVQYAFNFFRAPFSKSHGEFDFDSIMLYPTRSGFAKDPKKPTITKKNGEEYTINRTQLSELDLRAIDERYP